MFAGRLPPREELGVFLQHVRLRSGKRPIDVFEAGLLSVDELLQYEAGLVRADICVVHDLCEFYDADLRTTDQLVALALWMTTFGRLIDPAVSPRTSSGAWLGN
jgi:hypothetical protein